jgi:hypothetical protein
VEDVMIQPGYTSESVVAYRIVKSDMTLAPIIGNKLHDETSPEIDLYPGYAEWWRKACQLWTDHKTDNSPPTLLDRIDYHGGLDRQLPISPLRVVYGTSGSILTAALLEDSEGIIDSSLYWSAVASRREGFYLLAILNSGWLLPQVSEYQPEGLFGTRHFHKHVFEVPFPLFSPGDKLHEELADKAEMATLEAAQVDLGNLSNKQARKSIRSHLSKSANQSRIENILYHAF